MNKKKKIISWTIWLLWIMIIFFFSSQKGSTSGELSNSIVTFFNTFLPISISGYVIRKLAHFTEYFILSILTIHLLKCYRSVGVKETVYIILFCFLYASSDEFHQIFVSGRGPTWLDVMIDTSGSIIGCIIHCFLKNRSK